MISFIDFKSNFRKFRFILLRNPLKTFVYKHNTPHVSNIPSHDPNQPKKGTAKHHKTSTEQKGKIKTDEETPVHEGEDNLILKLPNRKINPYVMDIPKVDRHKNEKNAQHRPNYVNLAHQNQPESQQEIEDEIEIPETKLSSNNLTPNTPTTKVRVLDKTIKNKSLSQNNPSKKH
jgi:hypothetical protein